MHASLLVDAQCVPHWRQGAAESVQKRLLLPMQNEIQIYRYILCCHFISLLTVSPTPSMNVSAFDQWMVLGLCFKCINAVPLFTSSVSLK